MMTLANMRSLGIRSLSVRCYRCHHQALLDVDAYDDAVTVPSFVPRMVCTACGAIDADTRPNWNERAPPSLFGRSAT